MDEFALYYGVEESTDTVDQLATERAKFWRAMRGGIVAMLVVLAFLVAAVASASQLVDHGDAHSWHVTVPAHSERTYPGQTAGCFNARVDGKRGRWDAAVQDGPGYLFTFRHDGQLQGVVFDGIGFFNHASVPVHASAVCEVR